jgi:hypothetical protein
MCNKHIHFMGKMLEVSTCECFLIKIIAHKMVLGDLSKKVPFQTSESKSFQSHSKGGESPPKTVLKEKLQRKAGLTNKCPASHAHERKLAGIIMGFAYIKRKEFQIMKAYYKEKLKLLEDFGVPVTERTKAKLKRCTSEIQMDNICHSLIANWLDK